LNVFLSYCLPVGIGITGISADRGVEFTQPDEVDYTGVEVTTDNIGPVPEGDLVVTATLVLGVGGSLTGRLEVEVIVSDVIPYTSVLVDYTFGEGEPQYRMCGGMAARAAG
jgi:hypothetical protein